MDNKLTLGQIKKEKFEGYKLEVPVIHKDKGELTVQLFIPMSVLNNTTLVEVLTGIKGACIFENMEAFAIGNSNSEEQLEQIAEGCAERYAEIKAAELFDTLPDPEEPEDQEKPRYTGHRRLKDFRTLELNGVTLEYTIEDTEMV